MGQLENITRAAAVQGILPDGLVTVVDVRWVGTVAIEVTYKDGAGRLPDGAGDKLVRDVTENCRTLKFTTFGFEET